MKMAPLPPPHEDGTATAASIFIKNVTDIRSKAQQAMQYVSILWPYYHTLTRKRHTKEVRICYIGNFLGKEGGGPTLSACADAVLAACV